MPLLLQRMRPIVFGLQSDPGHPFINEAGILSGGDMFGVIDAARKDEFVKRTASAFEPDQDAPTEGLKGSN